MTDTILNILMVRDGMSKREALSLIDEARVELQRRIAENDYPEEICQEYFGLEPDYIFDLID
jgi:hypothetical protein